MTSDTFEKQCLPYYEAALRLARKLTGSKQQGEELVQDAVVRALGAWSRFVPESDSATKSWLMLIVSNTYFAQFRKRKFRAQCHTEHAEDIVQAIYFKNEAPLIDHSIGDEVAGAVADLDTSNRELLMRYVIQDQTAKEIALEMSIPPPAVYSRLNRSKDAMKRKLKNYAQSEYRIAYLEKPDTTLTAEVEVEIVETSKVETPKQAEPILVDIQLMT